MKPILAVLVLLAMPLAAAGSPEEPWRVSGGPAGPVSLTGIPVGVEPTETGTALGGGLRAWPQTILRSIVSPVFYDLNADGLMEVITADDRYLYVFTNAGALWPGWPRDIGGAMMHAAIADLDGDHSPEIMISSNLPVPRLWVFSITGSVESGWPVSIPYILLGNATCPVVVDLDADGRLEVGVAAEMGVFFYEANGAAVAGWPYLWSVPGSNPQWSAPAVGDLDNDGSLEVVVGNVNYPDSRVHVIRADGSVMSGWPQVVKPIWSSPALADLDGDGDLEIIVQEGDPGSQGYRMWVWHHDGVVFPGWPKAIAAEGSSSRSNPAVGDLEGDGRLEIVTLTGDGKLHVFLPDGTEYPHYPRDTGGVQPISSPTVIDMNNDGDEEIFFTYWANQNHYVSGRCLCGSPLSGFPKVIFSGTDLNSHASVHLTDFAGDGSVDLLTTGSGSSSATVWVTKVDLSVYDPNTTRQDWPKIRRDAFNRGWFYTIDPAAVEDVAGGAIAPLALGPNPVTWDEQICGRTDARQSGRLSVFDLTGRLLTRRTLATPWTLRVAEVFGREGRASGVYLMRWEPEGAGLPQTRQVVILGR